MAVYSNSPYAGMTLQEALNKGYTIGDVKWQRGYVSRKETFEQKPVYVAGGNRKGQLFVLGCSRKSTKYCYRLYLKEA